MISSITLHGFKSFSERIRLDFTGGICAVIGPNGSGKSNVVEAIRWATHNAKARELRAGRATELIFHGSGGKSALGLAEVQLEMNTQVGRVHISRRIYRDGSSEQDLNGKAVRARDIQGALRGSGLGVGGLAVIGQGEVSSVVQAESRTLLGYLQEAAGLSAAVGARQESENRLKDAETQLSKLLLLRTEKELSVERLAADAAQYRKHAELSTRLLVLAEAIHREKNINTQWELLKAKDEIIGLEAKSSQLSSSTAEALKNMEAAQEVAREAKIRHVAYLSAIETLGAAKEALAQAERYSLHLSNEKSELESELSSLVISQPEQAVPNIEAIALAVLQARKASEQSEATLKQLDKQHSKQQHDYTEAAKAEARAEASQETLKVELERNQEDLAAVQEAKAEAILLLERYSEAKAEAETNYSSIQKQRQKIKEHIQHLTSEVSRLKASTAPLERERTRLEQALNDYSRYGEGARNALRLDHAGIIGSVADLLSVPAEYETAITAALGRRLEQVVVGKADDAREIINELKRIGGRATFLPLDLLRPRQRRDSSLLQDPAVIGNLADLCPTDPPQVGEALMSDTLLVRDIAGTNRLAKSYSSRPRLVTLDGEIIESGGAITGGRLKDSGSVVLYEQRRFHELDDELRGSLSLIERLSLDIETQSGELENGRNKHDELLREQELAAQAERLAEQKISELGARERSLSASNLRLNEKIASLTQPTKTLSQTSVKEDLEKARQAAEDARASERSCLENLSAARELESSWKAYISAKTREADLKKRMVISSQSIAAQESQLASAGAEVLRRSAAANAFDSVEITLVEEKIIQTSSHYKTILSEQNKMRAKIEELNILVARKEGSLDWINYGCQLLGTAKDWTAELSSAREELDLIGQVNAKAEADYLAESEALDSQSREVSDISTAISELLGHLGELEKSEANSTKKAFDAVSLAFRNYSTELLGGEGELEAEKDQAGKITGLRLVVQPKGKRTRSMNLLSAGERTMAGLGFLFALGHAAEYAGGGLPLAVLDEVDAPLDEANIRRFTAFLKRFSANGTQFVLVTHQKATMEVAHALWGVTTDASGASKVLSIKQREDMKH